MNAINKACPDDRASLAIRLPGAPARLLDGRAPGPLTPISLEAERCASEGSVPDGAGHHADRLRNRLADLSLDHGRGEPSGRRRGERSARVTHSFRLE